MKEKLLWGALFLIGVSWVFNAFYAQTKLLDEPIFLEHIIHTPIQNNNVLSFYYLTNAKDDASVANIFIDGVAGYSTYAESDETIQTFSHYVLKRAEIDFPMASFEGNTFSTNIMDISFDDGLTMSASIGELTFHPFQHTNSALIPKGSSSGDGGNLEWYEAEENIIIDHFSTHLDEGHEKDILLSVNAPSIDGSGENGVPLRNLELPISLNKGEHLYIHWQVDPNFLGYIESSLVISGTTEAGQPFEDGAFIYSQLPELSNEEVKKIVQKGRAK